MSDKRNVRIPRNFRNIAPPPKLTPATGALTPATPINSTPTRGKVPAKVDEDPDSFYQGFNFTYTPGKSKADEDLRAAEESPDERILDLCLIMDCTGSMGSWIELCKRTLKEVIDEVLKEHEDIDVRVGFVAYRDFSDGNQILHVSDFSFDVEAIKNAITSQRATGGGDGSEDVQGGLYQAANLSWREGSLKVCYLCADAPAHGKAYYGTNHSSDNWPAGHPCGITIEDLMMQFSDREIDFSVYELNDNTKVMYEVMEQAYNQGKNANEFKRIELKQDIQIANRMRESHTKAGGHMERNYFMKTNVDLNRRAHNQKRKKGW